MAQQAYMTDSDNGGSGPERRGPRLRRLTNRLTAGWRGDPRIWRRGLITAALAILLALVMALHAQIPNRIGNLASLSETFLPWFGIVAVPLLLIVALVRRSATALIAVTLPTVVWFNLFGGLLGSTAGAGGDLMVATHNVNAENPDPSGTARDVAGSGADVVALEELTL